MSKKKRERNLPENEKIFDYLKQLGKLQSSCFFRKPVDIVLYNCANYYEVIKRPMDLETILFNLIQGYQNSLSQFSIKSHFPYYPLIPLIRQKLQDSSGDLL